MDEVIINSKNFENEVLKSSTPVLIDFWAQWCGPCRMLAPIIDDIAKEYNGKIKVGKVNVDYENNLAQTYEVLSIPTLILFKDGQIVETSVGMVQKSDIKKMLDLL